MYATAPSIVSEVVEYGFTERGLYAWYALSTDTDTDEYRQCVVPGATPAMVLEALGGLPRRTRWNRHEQEWEYAFDTPDPDVTNWVLASTTEIDTSDVVQFLNHPSNAGYLR